MWQPSSPQKLARRLQARERKSCWTAAVALGAAGAFEPAAEAQDVARVAARRRTRVRRRREGLGMWGLPGGRSVTASMAAGRLSSKK
jgi:hypothetical protein